MNFCNAYNILRVVSTPSNFSALGFSNSTHDQSQRSNTQSKVEISFTVTGMLPDLG